MTNPGGGAEKCWCVACGRRRRLFHTGALLTKPLSVEECLGHGPLLPLKANVHELRLVHRLGGFYFDLDLEDSTLTWTWRIKLVLRLGGLNLDWQRKTRVRSRRSNMLVVDD